MSKPADPPGQKKPPRPALTGYIEATRALMVEAATIEATEAAGREEAPDETQPVLPESDIGNRIREARERLGLSQAKFAELTKTADIEGRGIPRSVLIGYEAGKHKPGARELRVLCSALNIDIGALLYGHGTEIAKDWERARAREFAGTFSSFGTALRAAFAMMRAKPHEREALSSLIYGLASRTFGSATDAEMLKHLADLIELDLIARLSKVGELPDAPQLLDKAMATGEGIIHLLDVMDRLVRGPSESE